MKYMNIKIRQFTQCILYTCIYKVTDGKNRYTGIKIFSFFALFFKYKIEIIIIN